MEKLCSVIEKENAPIEAHVFSAKNTAALLEQIIKAKGKRMAKKSGLGNKFASIFDDDASFEAGEEGE
ncbi:MAG: hypothetical protein NC203_07845, partial [Firmicutes bacterium]|nr:hypothetical protein [Bacillota bacterium]